MVFCDWLDVTFSPADSPYPAVNLFLLGLGFTVMDTGDPSRSLYRPPDGLSGVIDFRARSSWSRASAAGGACRFLRDVGAWSEYLGLLGAQPHRVTRLDAALDLPMDGADLVDRMHQLYPATVHLGRKALSTSLLLAARPDGRQSGTWYAGHRSRARLTARVYDKAWEQLSKLGVVIPPTARVEITVRGDYGATLRDAFSPEGIFWEGASPAILPAPKVLPMRGDPVDTSWTAPPRSFDPALLLRRRVENLAELDCLCSVADGMGPNGRRYLLSLMRQRIDRALSGVAVSDPVDQVG